MRSWREGSDFPFVILAKAFKKLGGFRGLGLKDVQCLMENFRPGDDVESALKRQVRVLSGTELRRLKGLLLLMMYGNAITHVKDLYYPLPGAMLDLISGCNLQKKPPSEVSSSEAQIDGLVAALRLFQEHRLDDEWIALLKQDGYVGLHVRYEGMNPASLSGMSAAEFDAWCEKEVWSAQHFRCRDTLQKLSDVQKRMCAEFIAATKKNVQLVSHYFPTKDKCPEGFGPAVVTELLMKFHPLDYIGYNQLMLEGLNVLHLQNVEFKYDDALGYQKFLGVATVILDKMVQMKLPRSFDEDERSKPDFITVNEFLWWCKVNADLIKEEIDMGNINNLKRVEEKPTYEEGAKGLEAFGEDEMLKRLAAALKTKPFAILAGYSGTGKSQLVRRLAHMTCNVESLRKEADDTTLPGNYCMVQVKPNWHDSNDLLGYYSDMNGRHYRTTPFVEFVCKAYAYPDTPFFVCLDEMNLAPVEHYFAEYLSAIESVDIKGDVYVTDPVVTIDSSAGADGKKKRDGAIAMEMMGSQASANAAEWLMAHDLTLPKNLFVVGTVNMDETTQQFSRKVLDRAMTILMDRVDFASMKKPEMPKCMNEEAVKFFLGHSVKTDALTSEQAGLLGNVNEVLKNTSFVVAYRFANEYALYQEAIEQIDPSGKDEAGKAKRALDHMVMMKLLPRIHGERHDVAAIFGNEDGRDGLRKIVGSDGLSGVQMASILGRGGDYLTFWP